jgi:hypothetical protein
MLRCAPALEYPDAVLDVSDGSAEVLVEFALHEDPQTPEFDFGVGVEKDFSLLVADLASSVCLGWSELDRAVPLVS